MKKYGLVVACSFMVLATPAQASDTLTITNPSQIEWSIYSQKVYFRNFNTFDPTWLGCCYNYYFDLTTEEGRAMFSAFLTYQSMNKTMSFFVTSKSVAGPITQFGKF